MIQIRQILLPADFSECSETAAAYARDLALQFGAKIHVIHVLRNPVVLVPEPTSISGLIDIRSLRKSIRKSLTTWTVARFGEDSNAVCTLRMGIHFREILRYAQEHEIDLIVIGSHGRSGVKHALLGSVTERVARKAPCPVLTVRPAP